MRKNFLITAIFVLIFLFTSAVVYAAHYLTGYSAVDDDEIRWGGSTTYLTRWNAAISKWNTLDPVNIAADTASTWEDLTVKDVNLSNVIWLGRYSVRIGADIIDLNTYKLQNSTSAQRQNTAEHELGHSLGLAHSFSGNIMYTYQTSQTSLGSQDKSDYHYLWGY